MTTKSAMYAEYPQLSQPDDNQYPTKTDTTTTVTVPQTQTITYVADVAPEKWSWCNLVTSVFSFFCCTFFGVMAVIMAMLAYVDHKAKDFARSKKKRNAAWGLAITAIVIGAAAVLLVIALVVGWTGTLITAIKEMQKQNQDDDPTNDNVFDNIFGSKNQGNN